MRSAVHGIRTAEKNVEWITTIAIQIFDKWSGSEIHSDSVISRKKKIWLIDDEFASILNWRLTQEWIQSKIVCIKTKSFNQFQPDKSAPIAKTRHVIVCYEFCETLIRMTHHFSDGPSASLSSDSVIWPATE